MTDSNSNEDRFSGAEKPIPQRTFGHKMEVKTPDGKKHSVDPVETAESSMADVGKNASVGMSTQIGYRHTKKVGNNYQGASVQVTAWATVPCHLEEIDDGYDFCSRFVQEKLKKTIHKTIADFDLLEFFDG